MDENILTFIVIPLLIFIARILDVTLGTVKIILVSKGYRKIAPILAFFEVLIWLIVITQIMSRLDNVMNYIGYAAGFAMGTYIGIILEEKLAFGNVVFQVISKNDSKKLLDYLKEKGYDSTTSLGGAKDKPIHITFTVVPRKEISKVSYIIKQFNPKAFYTVEDVRYVSNESTQMGTSAKQRIKNSIARFRKSK